MVVEVSSRETARPADALINVSGAMRRHRRGHSFVDESMRIYQVRDGTTETDGVKDARDRQRGSFEEGLSQVV
jgi:hypothetical protein